MKKSLAKSSRLNINVLGRVAGGGIGVGSSGSFGGVRGCCGEGKNVCVPCRCGEGKNVCFPPVVFCPGGRSCAIAFLSRS
jgi:hypothetical protein